MEIDQLKMIQEVLAVALTSLGDSLPMMLKRLAETTCQVFRFSRATVSLLDDSTRMYRTRAAAGPVAKPETGVRNQEVPPEVIERLFAGRYRVKMVYHDRDQQDMANYLDFRIAERRTQQRRRDGQWHQRDLVAVNLMNGNGTTFGFLTLSDPAEDSEISRDFFHNLEIYGQCVSAAIRYFNQYKEKEKQSRRCKQLLAAGDIFRLRLSLSELFKELVWKIRFSTDFRLVMLGLIDKEHSTVNMKAVACTDKMKARQLQEVRLPLRSVVQLLGKGCQKRKSYLVTEPKAVFQEQKRIYYGSVLSEETPKGFWPKWAVLILPIHGKEEKLYGFLVMDDPVDEHLPSPHQVHLLEILSSHIAVAIENRTLYLQARKRDQELVNKGEDLLPKPDFNENPTLAIKRMADNIFKDFKWRY